MYIEQIHKDILMFLRKNLLGHFSHEQIDDALHRAQMAKFVELYGNVKDYQHGRPVPRISFGSTWKVNDDLRKFISPPTTVSVSSGQVAIASNYVHTIVLRTTDNKDIDRVNENEVASRLGSHIFPASTTNPIATMQNDHIKIYPTSVSNVIFSYLRTPVKPVYAYTLIDSGRRSSFDSGSSTDIEWPEITHNDIVMRTLNYLGLPIKDEFVLSYTKDKERSGN